MSSSRHLPALFAALAVASLAGRNLSAQSGSTVQVSAGAVTMFGHSGGYGSLALIPIRIYSGSAVQLRAGASAWLGWTSSDVRVNRRLFAGGPMLDLGYQPVGSDYSLNATVEVQRIQSDLPYASAGGDPSTPPEDQPAKRAGWAYGGKLGVGRRVAAGIGIRASIGYLHHSIFAGRAGGLWRVGVGVVLGG